MHTTVRMGEGRPKRKPIRRIVFTAIVLAALAEPLVMYVALSHERAQRRAIIESALSSSVLVTEK